MLSVLAYDWEMSTFPTKKQWTDWWQSHASSVHLFFGRGETSRRNCVPTHSLAHRLTASSTNFSLLGFFVEVFMISLTERESCILKNIKPNKLKNFFHSPPPVSILQNPECGFNYSSLSRRQMFCVSAKLKPNFKISSLDKRKVQNTIAWNHLSLLQKSTARLPWSI